MEQYIAFLRGINVSGQKLIKMETLRKVLTDLGFSDVKTFIQSGNVVFNTAKTNTNQLITIIEDLIETQFGFRTDVILRCQNDIESVLNSMQNSRLESGGDRKYYITFLKAEYYEPLIFPLFSKNKDVEVIYQNKKDFISVSNLFKGSYGFPNAFIEKLTGIPATTRNPDTLKKILDL